MIQEVLECEQGVDTHARGRGLLELAPSQGVAHPRRHGDLYTLRELDDETLRGLAPSPADHLDHLSAEGMVRVPDLGYRRIMSSVSMSGATAMRPISWKQGTTFAPSRNYSVTKM